MEEIQIWQIAAAVPVIGYFAAEIILAIRKICKKETKQEDFCLICAGCLLWPLSAVAIALLAIFGGLIWLLEKTVLAHAFSTPSDWIAKMFLPSNKKAKKIKEQMKKALKEQNQAIEDQKPVF
jgi:nucleoside permease NupC